MNGVALSKDESVFAVGDDYGLVNLYRNPVVDDTHQARSLRGHSEHVVRVAFTMKDKYMLSIGGYDQTIILWKKVSKKEL